MSEFLKCDAPGCDHYEETPVTIDVVDKPCPKCGANLCTEQDFIDFRTFTAAQTAAHEVHMRKNPNAKLRLVAHNVHQGEVHRAVDIDPSTNPFPNPQVSA